MVFLLPYPNFFPVPSVYIGVPYVISLYPKFDASPKFFVGSQKLDMSERSVEVMLYVSCTVALCVP